MDSQATNKDLGMTFDANGIICTDIHKASLELLSPEELTKISVVNVSRCEDAHSDHIYYNV